MLLFDHANLMICPTHSNCSSNPNYHHNLGYSIMLALQYHLKFKIEGRRLKLLSRIDFVLLIQLFVLSKSSS